MLVMPKQKLFLLGFVFLLLYGQCHAQEEFIAPARQLTKMPFRQLTGGVVLLQARFANFPDTLNFILDTGSGGISLDSTTTVYFGLKPTPSDRTIRGIAGVRTVSFLYNQKLHLPGLTVDSLNFHINNYDVLTQVYGEKIDGIIGYSFLSRYIVKVDYDTSQLEVWTRGSLKYPRGGYLMRPVITTLPVQQARVRDDVAVNSRFLYDMGAGLCLMLSTDFVRDSALLDKRRKLYVKEAEGLGGKIDMHMTVVREVKIGPFRFKNVPVYIFDDDYNITSYPYLGGLIGNDLLRRFNTILNYENRNIYMVPNKHFNDPFDYSYSGIELYYINGQVLIGDVAKGSPAEKAGVQEGDVVISINNVFGSLDKLKSALQGTGERIRLILRRNDALVEYDFKAKNILSRR
jgi:hypothetical protein